MAIVQITQAIHEALEDDDQVLNKDTRNKQVNTIYLNKIIEKITIIAIITEADIDTK